MGDFGSEGKFGMALCVFTVILYLLNEVVLENSFAAAYKSLKLGGKLLVDIPSKELFTSYLRSSHNFDRHVSVIRNNHDSTYIFRKELTIEREDGYAICFVDEFNIRHWSDQKVFELLPKIGFEFKENVTLFFPYTG
jgi:hypothetical protein